VCEEAPVAQQQQPAAVIGLVHDVAGDQQGGAAGGEPVELFPQVHPQHRVQPDGGLVEYQQVGVGHQCAGQRHPGTLTTGKIAAQRSSMI
jgi:hypothetical protein